VNRAAVTAELPPAVAAWLVDARASDGTWESVARDLAYLIGVRVLINDGEGGWNSEVRAILARDASPGVRAVVARLPVGSRSWTATDVAREVCAHLDIPGAGGLKRVIKPRAAAA
jgi:hypothetical protein